MMLTYLFTYLLYLSITGHVVIKKMPADAGIFMFKESAYAVGGT